MNNPPLGVATRWGLNALLLLSFVISLYLGHRIFIPTVIALLLTATLWPATCWLNQGVPLPGVWPRAGFPWLRWRPWKLPIPWGLACLITVTGVVLLVLLVTTALAVAIPKMVQDLPDLKDYQQRQIVYEGLRTKILRTVPGASAEYLPPNAEDARVFRALGESLDPKFIFNVLLEFAGFGGNMLFTSILIMFILLFLLLEGPMLGRRVAEICGTSTVVQQRALAALADMAFQIRAYLVWRTIINFGMAILLGGFYYIMPAALMNDNNMKQPALWALLTAILWYIPYLGPIIAGVPPVVDAFLSCDNPGVALLILLVYTVVVILEGYLVVPVVMGRSMEMNATTVMLACLFWEVVWGTAGLFLAMPLMAAIKAVCAHVPDWKPWANLMSNHDPAPPPPDPTLVAVADADLAADTALLTPEEARQVVASQKT